MTNKLPYYVLVFMAAYFFIPKDWLFEPTEALTFNADSLREVALTFDQRHLPQTVVNTAYADLGKAIFFDTRLSKNHQVACASCHNPGLGFSDGRDRAQGIDIGPRNTPTLINIAWSEWLFWDGRSYSLAHQALGPLESPIEHGLDRLSLAEAVIRYHEVLYQEAFGLVELSEDFGSKIPTRKQEQRFSDISLELATYGLATLASESIQLRTIKDASRLSMSPQELFQARYGRPTQTTIKVPHSDSQKLATNQIAINAAIALDHFQRTIVALSSPFDEFIAKLSQSPTANDAFSDRFGPKQWQGFQVFIESGCHNCHSGPRFTDDQFHNIGLPILNEKIDLGRALGIMKIDQSTIPCSNLESETEACREIPYLNKSAIETMGAFKTPTLRNLTKTQAFMHDGRFDSIDQVLQHYLNVVGGESQGIGHTSESLIDVNWSEEEIEHLKMFLDSLNSPITFHE